MTAQARLLSLDLLRGVAVLGILTINITGFAGPLAGTISPALTRSHTLVTSSWDNAAFAVSLVLFEGKMRALFSLLFGAGVMLFWQSAERRGADGDVLQVRRLAWLLGFGFLHYVLLWWGDILFVYALCGLAALMLRPLPPHTLVIVALALFYGWHLWGLFELAPIVRAETALREGHASTAQAKSVAAWFEAVRAGITEDLTEARYTYLELALTKLRERPFWQVSMTWNIFSETLPLMLLGMVLVRSGFFDPAKAVKLRFYAGLACGLSGLAFSATFTAWALSHDFPPVAMEAALSWGLALPHLLTAMGYASLLVHATPRLAPTRLGQRLIATGRMAFSNYIATSLVMTAIFYGWGLGLFAHFGPAAQVPFVLLGWALMLGVSAPFLTGFRRGPLEWLWRSLVEKRWLHNGF
ncbi:DUF418 domain-containing protein [Novosphingobium mangrovi (ex Hu et al. 2023)]|uniref:DUF418 domain-containing protein n=1 Tax=Novosphingobium mangrovi (ex Hu et al. 2023) TaxID=2930094 RepID=A0ABT0AHA6_9SPHN|nr:DUF418 domain-containing protein [Novosphingobium mangrovi (ex Hu et al. 2023)]MCJ1962550.1 DUF418 domain-containing protein [Novosphingobium mangrovi (ex Hu et al. 2023)]